VLGHFGQVRLTTLQFLGPFLRRRESLVIAHAATLLVNTDKSDWGSARLGLLSQITTYT
jgi:hypothetical protein